MKSSRISGIWILCLFNEVIAFDHYRQKVLLITGVMTENLEESYKRACKKLEEMTELIKKGEKRIFPPIRLRSRDPAPIPERKVLRYGGKSKALYS